MQVERKTAMPNGLDGIVAADTVLSHTDRERGIRTVNLPTSRAWQR
jgi:hypothetical protein